MTPTELRQRTKTFAIETRVISWQLQRCGPAVGANYRATCRCRSDNDFIAKLGVVIEEADESAFWLEILGEAEIVRPAATKRLLNEADELTRIFVSSRETARRNRRLRQRGDRVKANSEPEP